MNETEKQKKLKMIDKGIHNVYSCSVLNTGPPFKQLGKVVQYTD